MSNFIQSLVSFFGKMVNLISDIYGRIRNVADDCGLIDKPFEFSNIELISVIYNDADDITKQFLCNFGKYAKKQSVYISDVLQSELLDNFENIEITVMIELCMFSFIHTNIYDVLYFQYGLEWPKYTDYSDDLYRLRYLDLAIV